MAGQMFLHLWCECGHVGRVAHREAWLVLTREQLLPMFKCRKCGQQPQEMRRIWEMPERPVT